MMKHGIALDIAGFVFVVTLVTLLGGLFLRQLRTGSGSSLGMKLGRQNARGPGLAQSPAP